MQKIKTALTIFIMFILIFGLNSISSGITSNIKNTVTPSHSNISKITQINNYKKHYMFQVNNFTGNAWNPYNGIYPYNITSPMLASNSTTAVLFGGEINGTDVNYTWVYYKGSGWVNISTQKAPPPIIDGAFVYDPANNAFYLFGGIEYIPNNNYSFHIYNQLWEFKNNAWQNITNIYTEPPEMFGMAYTFIPSVNELLIIGGFTQNNTNRSVIAPDNYTFLFNPSTGWSNITSNTFKQNMLHYAYAVYDSSLNEVILYASNSGYTWAYSPQSNVWSNISTSNAPPKRLETSFFIYNNELLVYGGRWNTTIYSDTYSFSQSSGSWQWQNITNSVNSPGAEYGMAYSYYNNYTLIMNGMGINVTNQMWSFDGSWYQMKEYALPPMEHYAYASTPEGEYLFGGSIGNAYSNQMWFFSYSSNLWKNITLNNSPSPRQDALLCYDSATNSLYLYGGYNGIFDNDLWEFYLNNNTWVNLNKPNIGVEYASGAVFENNIIVYGGNTSNGISNLTYAFNLTTYKWYLENYPMPHLYGSAYVYTHSGILIAGGTGYNGESSNAYLYDGTWMAENNFTLPKNSFMSAAYNSYYNEIILYGGLINNFTSNITIIHKIGDGWMPATVSSITLNSTVIAYNDISNTMFMLGFINGKPSFWKWNAINATLPGVPTNLNIIPQYNGFNASWSAPSNTGGGKILYYCVNVSNQSSSNMFISRSNNISIKDLKYLYANVSIDAVNGLGKGPFSASIPLTIYEVPSQPRNVKVNYYVNYIKISWKTPSVSGNSNILNYTIYYKYNNSIYGLSTGLQNIYFLTDYPLTSSLNCWIVAWNRYGESPGTSFTLNTYNSKNPPMPTNFTVKSGLGNISLSWNVSAYQGNVLGIVISYGLFTFNLSNKAFTTSSNYRFSNLKANVKYYFSIFEEGISLNSSDTPVKSGILYTPPNAPDNITGSVNYTGINIIWNVKPGSIVNYFFIYLGTSPSNMNLVANVSGNNFTFSFTGLKSGTKYYIQIFSINAFAKNGSGIVYYTTLNIPTSNLNTQLLYFGISVGIFLIAMVVYLYANKIKNKKA
ncbi:MAG: Kelch repeat-containing protein [Thermoplasmata archaeon]